MPNSSKSYSSSPQAQRARSVGSKLEPSSAIQAPASHSTEATTLEQLLTPGHLLALQRTTGNRAVTTFLAANPPVQRLVSTESFKQTSKTGPLLGPLAKRNAIVLIDTALDQYNKTPLTPLPTKIAEIDNLITKCDNYIAPSNKQAKRKRGTMRLRDAARAEKAILERLRDNPSIPAKVARLLDLREIENLYHSAQGAGYQPDKDIFAHIQTEMKAIPITSTEAATLQQADITSLRQIARDPKTPPVLANVIREVLANTYDTRLTNTTAGSGAAHSPAGGTNYEVTYGQYLGDAERLGTLVHEMTHVSVGESYGNTKGFLSYAKDATIPEIIALSDRRTRLVNNLQAVLATDKSFSDPQRDKINGQLDYPLSQNKMGNYTSIIIKDGSHESTAAAQKLNDALVESGGRLNLTVFEYDTVINQIMVYMHIWNIPPKNAFYTQLRNAAQEAYDQREVARNE